MFFSAVEACRRSSSLSILSCCMTNWIDRTSRSRSFFCHTLSPPFAAFSVCPIGWMTKTPDTSRTTFIRPISAFMGWGPGEVMFTGGRSSIMFIFMFSRSIVIGIGGVMSSSSAKSPRPMTVDICTEGSLKSVTLTFKFRWKKFATSFLSTMVVKSSGKLSSSSNLIAIHGVASALYGATFHARHLAPNFVYFMVGGKKKTDASLTWQLHHQSVSSKKS